MDELINAIAVLLCATIGWGVGRVVRWEANDFKTDWYAYLTNQISHMMLGIFLVCLYMTLGYLINGVLPSRLWCFFAILAGYVTFEIFQRGKINDIIEDTMYVVFYGAGMVLCNFKSIAYDKAEINLHSLIPITTLAITHLTIGCYKRR